jgi:prolyl oligopeptidase
MTTGPETVSWVTAQNELTESFLAAVESREEIRAQVTRMWDFPKLGVPFERGGRWFQFRNAGMDPQSVLCLLDKPGGAARPLLDPSALSPDGTTAVSLVDVSGDGSMLAYATSDSGSDWLTWHIRDVETGADLADVIRWSKFSRAAWLPDRSGFYYCAGQPPEPGAEYLEPSAGARIFLHQVGTPQADDEIVYSPPAESGWYPYAEVSGDGRFLIVALYQHSVFENELHVLDLQDPQPDWTPLVGDFESVSQLVTSEGTTFYLVTDYGAGRKRLVAVDLDRPERENWREIIAETPDTLQAVRFFGGYFVCHYLRDAHSVLRVHARDGRHVRDIPLPGISSLGLDPQLEWALTGGARSDLMHFSTTSFTDPGAIWSHQLSTGVTEIIENAAAAIDPGRYLTEQVFAESADGTLVPIFLTRHKDLKQDGQAPGLLYGYGGFDISITPYFSPDMAVWLERGGVLAVANLRGGGEYGRAWHEGGWRGNKQNVFDDFCACARWLTSSGWSSRDRLAIMGHSGGGLLVGACLTQHPELFGAVVGHAGVYDMLRFHRFTIGSAIPSRSAARTTRKNTSGCAATHRCTKYSRARATRRRCCSPAITTTASCQGTRSSSRLRCRPRRPATSRS